MYKKALSKKQHFMFFFITFLKKPCFSENPENPENPEKSFRENKLYHKGDQVHPTRHSLEI